MEAIAKTRHLKGSPRKARLVIDLIRGRNVSQALNILKFTDKRAADPIVKTLRSAIANATYLAEQQNIAIDPDDLFVKTCFVDMGAHKNRRRMRPAPQGRAFREQRHYCHITILVSSDAPADTKSARKSMQTAGEKGDAGGAKTKAAPKPEAIKKTKKTDGAKETKKASADEAAKVKETKRAKAEKPATADETVEPKTTVVETAQTQATTVEEPSVETPETLATTNTETPKIEDTVETKSVKTDEPNAEKTKEPKTAKAKDSEASDILEMNSPKGAKAKEEKQKAEASDAKNGQSQTPAERNETKQADERQLDENDILELQ
jgi:large subunit ribosomal protein L22